MKGCYCPNCGRKQKFKLEDNGKVTQPCHICGHPMMAKNDEIALTVKVYHLKNKGEQSSAGYT